MNAIKCPLCGGVHSKLAFRVGDVRVQRGGKTFDYYRCADCTATFIHPFPDYVALEDFYGEEYFAPQALAPTGRTLSFFQTVKKAFGIGSASDNLFYKERNKIFSAPGGNFLDVGCATGMQNIRLMREFPSWHFYGVEPDEFAFQQAKQLPNFHVTKGFLQDAHFPDDLFDVILVNQVLEHTEDPLAVLAECRRILKSGGKLIVAVPDKNSLSGRAFGKRWYNVDAPRHLWQFNKKSLQILADKANLRVTAFRREHLHGSFIKSALIMFGIAPDRFDRSVPLLFVKNITKPINFGGGLFMITTK